MLCTPTLQVAQIIASFWKKGKVVGELSKLVGLRDAYSLLTDPDFFRLSLKFWFWEKVEVHSYKRRQVLPVVLNLQPPQILYPLSFLQLQSVEGWKMEVETVTNYHFSCLYFLEPTESQALWPNQKGPSHPCLVVLYFVYVIHRNSQQQTQCSDLLRACMNSVLLATESWAWGYGGSTETWTVFKTCRSQQRATARFEIPCQLLKSNPSDSGMK